MASTRRSALDPALPPNLPEYALDLADALCHATRDAAYSCRAEHQEGRIVAGHLADFAVLDADPFAAEAAQLLSIRTRLTAVGGRVVFEAAGARPPAAAS